MKVSPARSAAFDILLKIGNEHSNTSVLLADHGSTLSHLDRKLCHELVFGTLRRQLYLDRLIDHLTRGKKLDPEIRLALRLGLYQLRFLERIPPYSAINESVELAQRAKKGSAKGLVNAVLRRAISKEIDPVFADESERIAIEGSHPKWLIERWEAILGSEESSALITANNLAPVTAFRVLNRAFPGIEELIMASSSSKYVDGCYLIRGHGQTVNDLASANAIYVQDEGSQLVATAVDTARAGRVLDVCAAPGGKTGMIATRKNAPSIVAAGELRFDRARYLLENCQRQNARTAHVVQHDAAAALPFADGTFDAVLVDAPCSGTGTIRHHPEIRYFVSDERLARHSNEQFRILLNAGRAVASHGRLIYSTCSLEPEENEDVCGKFLTEDPRFIQVRPHVPEELITSEGYARTWPHRHNMDGFFIAAFEKRG